MRRAWWLSVFIAVLASPPARALEITDARRAAPAIHGPRIIGAGPGRPFLFRVGATGVPMLSFSAEGLPPGLALNPDTGVISGRIEKPGRYLVRLAVENPAGQASRNLVIVCGPRALALTPPMGWNSWNVWAVTVDDAKVRAAARALRATGLADHGFAYINIDDGWMKSRGPDGRIIPDPARFPDMKALAEYVHSLGLKLGIYSSPGPTTCQGLPGSMGHEEQDAATWAEWGIDYLKYDWCSYTSDAIGRDRIRAPHFFYDDHLYVHFDIPVEEQAAPYLKMRAALDGVDRDIVFALCPLTLKRQGSASRWGRAAGGNLWRVGGDIRDNWRSMSRLGFAVAGMSGYAGPGGWNDPDMLVVGWPGWGEPRPTGLTPDEQVLHLTLWSMAAAPLLLGCDLERLDPFTLTLLTNDEVIEVDQDPLGKAGDRRWKLGGMEVWSRPLWDGTVAVALFNRSGFKQQVTARWRDVGLSGEQPVRDLWRHEDLGSFSGSYTATVPSHGAVMLKVGRPVREDFE